MNYSEAFLKSIDLYGLDILDNSFLLSSFISDHIKNSSKEKRLLETYLLLNKDNHIYQSIRGYPLEESKKIIKEEIDKLDDVYSASEYIKSIEPLLLILYKDEYKLMGDGNTMNIAINSVNMVDDDCYEEDIDGGDEEDEEDLDDYATDEAGLEEDETESADYVDEDSDSADTETEETSYVNENPTTTDEGEESYDDENLDLAEEAAEETPIQIEEEILPKPLLIKIGPRIRNTYIRIGSTSNNYYAIGLSFNHYVPIENIVK